MSAARDRKRSRDSAGAAAGEPKIDIERQRSRQNRSMDLYELAGQLSDALGFIECAVTAIGAQDCGGPELVVLEHGLEALRQVHRDLDRASMDSR